MYLSKVEREKNKMKETFFACINKTYNGSCNICLSDFDLVDDIALCGYLDGLFEKIVMEYLDELGKDVSVEILLAMNEYSKQQDTPLQLSIRNGVDYNNAKISFLFMMILSSCSLLGEHLGFKANTIFNSWLKRYEQEYNEK